MKQQRHTGLLTCFLLTLFITGVHAQRAYQKKHCKIEGYYGAPNMTSQFIKSFYGPGGTTYYHLYSSGPGGVRFEANVANWFAIGMDMNFLNTHIDYGVLKKKYDPVTQTYYDYVKSDTIEVTRVRLMATANFHFGRSKHFDWYAGTALGFNIASFNRTDTVKDYELGPPDYVKRVSFPIAGRLQFGVNYYLLKWLAFSAQTGIGGGPLFSLGVTVKFGTNSSDQATTPEQNK